METYTISHEIPPTEGVVERQGYCVFSNRVQSRGRWLATICLLVVAIFGLGVGKLNAQCSGPNLLTNPSFETPVVPNVNGTNNVIASIPGWTNISTSPGTINVLRPNGTGLTGPNTPADGSQYIDLQGTTGVMDQPFSLTAPAQVAFSGSFANRGSSQPGYAPGEVGVQIFNELGVPIAIAMGTLTAALGDQTWLTIRGISSLLPAGNYTYRFYARTDNAHYDNFSLCIATNAAQSCANRTVLKPQPGWSATASSQAGSLGPAYTIDGSTKDDGSSVWATGTTAVAGQFITFDYGAPLNLVGFVYYPRTQAAQDIYGYTVQTSNDGVNFTTVQTGSIVPQTVKQDDNRLVGNPHEVDFVTVVNARYMRLIVNSAYQNSYASIAELLPIVCASPTLSTITCNNAGLLNTGTNSTGDGLATLDRFDANWEVTWVPNNTTATYATVANATFLPAVVGGNKVPNGGAFSWANSPFGNANWISYTTTSLDVNQTLNPPAPNDYFFRYRFTITDTYLLSAFKLKLNFMADNEVQNVYVNGIGQAPQLNLPQANGNYLYSGFTLANQATTTLQNNWQLGVNEIVVHIKSSPGAQGFLGQNVVSCPGLDYGDAPASYNVSRTTGGAGHIVEMDNNGVVTLKLGNLIDSEADGVASVSATSDDTSNFDDEDGIATFPVIQGANNLGFSNYTVNVALSNNTGATANLCGWIDWNNNGVFDASESACVTVANGATSAQLVWPSTTLTGVTGSTLGTYARFRITTDALASGNMNGAASNGEVEDYFIPFCVIPPPTVTLVTPATICSGNPVSINFTTSPVGQTVQWIRMPGGVTGVGNIQDAPTATGTTPVSYTYSAWINNAAGSCASTTAITTVTVNPVPEIIPSICSQTICSGTVGAITFTSSVSATINWLRVEDGATGTGNISQSFTTPGTYTYKIWGVSLPPASCPSSTTITCIIVVTPGLTVTAFANSATVCTGSPLSLSAAVVPAAGSYTYSWTGPNGYTGSGANPTVAASAVLTQSGTYTVVVTDAGNCSGTATVDVVVNACCDLIADAIPTSVTSCLSTNSGTIAITYTGSGSYQYSLNGGAFQALSASPTTISGLAAGSYTVVVKAVGDPTCTTELVAQVNAYNLGVALSSNSPLCTGNTLDLTAIPGGGTAPYSFTYTGPAGVVQSGTTLTTISIPNTTSANAGVYTVRVSDALGCTALSSTTVAITNAPNLTVTAGSNLTICSGQSTTLNVGGSNGAPVNWTNNLNQSGTGTQIDTGILTNIGTQPMYVIYNISALAGSCSSAISTTVTVNPEPRLQVMPSAAVYCDGEQVSLTATAFPSTATINWNRTPTPPTLPANRTGVGSVTIQETLPAGTYTYTFTATGTNGCTSQPVSVPVTVQQ